MFQISRLMHTQPCATLTGACYIFSRIVKQVFNLSDLDIKAHLSFDSEHLNLSSQLKIILKSGKL